MAAMIRRFSLAVLFTFFVIGTAGADHVPRHFGDVVIPEGVFIPPAFRNLSPAQFREATLIRGEYRPTLITSDAAGTHTTTAGTPYMGLNVDGVGLLSLITDLGVPSPSSCTGSLISDNHILTAAHCMSTDLSGNNNLISGNVTFQTPGMNYTHNFTGADVSVYAPFDGDVAHGNDLAIITLPDGPVNAAVPRYEIVGPSVYDVATNTGAPEIGVTHIKVGYGNSGFGDTGADDVTFPPGTKRAGQNVWEEGGITGHDPAANTFVTNHETQLTYDYDNGTASGPFLAPTGQDGFGWLSQNVFSPGDYPGRYNADTGLGTEEVLVAPGDSGGPTFVDDNGTFKIAGVSSYVLRQFLSPGGPVLTPDIDGTMNFSFGEFGTDARIANPAMNAFISSAIAVPEPSSFLFLGLVVVSFAGVRRGQTWLRSMRQ